MYYVGRSRASYPRENEPRNPDVSSDLGKKSKIEPVERMVHVVEKNNVGIASMLVRGGKPTEISPSSVNMTLL